MFSIESIIRFVGVLEAFGVSEEVRREIVGRCPPGKMYLRMKSVEEA